MQLIDLLTNAIALFSAVYFLLTLGVHLWDCWENPPVKAKAITLTLLLLPPAVEPHPFEMSLEKMPALETIAALHPPAAAVEPETEEAIELPPVEVAPHVESDAPISYQAMTSQQLRKVCGGRGIRWRSVNAGKPLSKLEMLAALTAECGFQPI